MIDSSTIQLDLLNWAVAELEDKNFSPAGNDVPALRAISGDAGFRQYYRINIQDSVLVVFAPPETEDSRAFARIGEFLLKNGVRTPVIIAADFARGFLLVENLGEDILLQHLCDETVDTLYSEVLMSLLRIQQSPLDHAVFPLYEKQKLRQEMALFTEWFVAKQLKLALSETEERLIENVFSMLEKSADEQPKVVVHRDFHSRNLMFAIDGDFGLIDFQDAVIGPITYDLVSLLKDCYIQWEPERVRRWALAYANMAIDIGIMPPVSEDVFLRWFDWMGLQRHIKVLGIFCRLSIRDNKHQYLNDLPMVVAYLRTTLAKYSQFEEFSVWFERTLMPIINRQTWMRDGSLSNAINSDSDFRPTRNSPESNLSKSSPPKSNSPESKS